MKSQILAIAVFILTFCAIGNSQAPLLPSGPPSFCEIQLVILQSEANKLNTPNLPEDLRIRIGSVLQNAASGCSDCDGLIVWLNKVCLVINLRAGLNQLSQIKAEAEARATTAAAPVTAAPPTTAQ